MEKYFWCCSFYRITTGLVNSLRMINNNKNISESFGIPIYRDGIYFYKITAGDFSETKKLILIK